MYREPRRRIPRSAKGLWDFTESVARLEFAAHFDLLYSNSMCRQSSMPTSIFIELFESGGMR